MITMKEGGFIIERCAFCGRDIDEVNKLIKSAYDESVYICDKCSRTVMSLIQRDDRMEVCKSKRVWEEKRRMEREKKRKEAEKPFTLTPHQIHKELDRFIIGQEQAKKVLSVAIYNHNKRLHDKSGLIKKSNILLAGPTGCGKTLLARTMAKILNVPFVIVDATSMTEAGYVGDDVEICLQRLLDAADDDLELAQKGIVYLDEIDKIARIGESRGKTRDISGEGVQSSLLKLMEGCEVSVTIKKKQPQMEKITFDTSNILFICGGAFEGLLGSTESQPIGFSSGKSGTADIGQEITGKLTQDSLKKYGLMPELVGRLPVLCPLSELNGHDLIRILTEPEDAITKEYQLLFEKDGTSLIFEEDALLEIANLALAKGTGARGLRTILENALLQTMYDLPEQDILECIITKECIQTKVPTTIIRKEPPAASAPY